MPLARWLLAGALWLHGTQEPKPPEFRADVRMIRLDVSVVDGAGRPVAGLEAQDFVVSEEGRPVPITFFEAVEARSDAAELAGTTAGGAAASRRRVLLLVDAGPMTPVQVFRAREAAARYLREGAVDGDWVRLVNLSSGRAWDGWMPSDRARLEAAARSLARVPSAWAYGGALMEPIEERAESDTPDMPSEAETSGQFLSAFAQTSGLLGMLESLLVQLGGVEGRKAVVLISPGFPQLRSLDERLQQVSSLARQAATAVYFVDAMGLDGLLPEGPGSGRLLPAFESAWRRSGGAQDLAEATGGFTSRFSNSLLPALLRVASELRTYYVIGYVPPRPADGRFRNVRVRVNVPGVTARTKKGYLAGGRG